MDVWSLRVRVERTAGGRGAVPSAVFDVTGVEFLLTLAPLLFAGLVLRFVPRKQLRASSNAITCIMAGSSSTMERETVLPKGVTFGAEISGTGDSTVQSRWTMGSQSTMERTTVSRTGPTFGAEYAGTGDKNSTSRLTQGFP